CVLVFKGREARKNKDILLLNDSLISLLNHKPGFYLGKNILSLSRNEKLNDCLAKAVEGQKQIMDMNINNRQWQLLADPIYNNDKFLGVLCLILDITERKEMDQIKQEFTSNVSHELKTPLTSILGYAEMIDQGIAKPEDIRLFANKIHQEAERLLTLIGDIIRLSQLDEMNMEIDKEEINLYAIAQECLDNLTVYAKKRQVKLSLTGEDCCILANKMMMEELIYNICDNAIRYNKLGGEVHLQIYQRSAELVINLKDTGVGIAPEHQKRIFERFYRVDKSHSKETGGTGLGLAIVKHIVERQQGHLSLFSREGLGTEIEIIF
ncbi:MAG: ATP-binding protein, partial [Clostridiales bacterium]